MLSIVHFVYFFICYHMILRFSVFFRFCEEKGFSHGGDHFSKALSLGKGFVRENEFIWEYE